jgi:hypothetical protein
MTNTQSPLGKQSTSWATRLIEALERGETVTTRPSGKSMEPVIPSKALCTIIPLSVDWKITTSDIVLVTCADNTYLHRVGCVVDIGGRLDYRIENLSGRSNGWVTRDKIHGVLVMVEP